MTEPYFAPGTCSLSPHIVLRELALPFVLVRVDNRTKQTSEGGDFRRINPRGYVAALRLDDGRVLTEGPAIVQYLADLKPGAGLAPPQGSWERSQLQEWLNIISSEIHAGCIPLFDAGVPPEAKALFRNRLATRLGQVASRLAGKDHLVGAAFGVADAPLHAVLRWMPSFGIDLQHWPDLAAFQHRVGTRPSVAAALAAEAAFAP